MWTPTERLDVWRTMPNSDRTEPISGLDGRGHRFGLMPFAILDGRRRPLAEADQVLRRIREAPELPSEVNDLPDILADRVRTAAQPLDAVGNVPLASHATYNPGEIVAAHRHTDQHGSLLLQRSSGGLNRRQTAR